MMDPYNLKQRVGDTLSRIQFSQIIFFFVGDERGGCSKYGTSLLSQVVHGWDGVWLDWWWMKLINYCFGVSVN